MSTEIDSKYISAIAHALLERSSPVSANIMAGTTYLGQFISHDIVPATNKGRQSRNVTPYLNLDSIYGKDNTYLSDDGTFPIRPIRGEAGDIIGYDVPREKADKGFVAKIPEPRNDDVVITTQLHAFFQRLHNAILKSGYVVDWVEAKEYTTLVFQLLVIEEFARPVLDKHIFEDYFERGKSYYNLWDKSQIPTFFSNAAMRFGHSLVRPDYIFRKGGRVVSLPQMFTTNLKLTPDLTIDFRKFFGNKRAQPAMQIDGRFASSLGSVAALDKSFNAINLIEKNLIAGFHADLPNGMELVNSISDLPSINKTGSEPWYDTFETSDFAQFLSEKEVSSSIDDLPLWPFILLEAELTGGERLGQIGSILTAEVITNAIASAEYSVLGQKRYDPNKFLSERGPLGSLFKPKGRLQKFGFMKVLNTMVKLEKR